MLKKAAQQGRSKRRGDAYSVPYVEPLSEARTPLADFFSILLEPYPNPQPKQDPQRHQPELLHPIREGVQ